MLSSTLLLGLSLLASAYATPLPRDNDPEYDVLILGGGVAGIIAAQQLHDAGYKNFLIVEARDELGGRLHSYDLDGYTVEVGANWVQGTQTGRMTSG